MGTIGAFSGNRAEQRSVEDLSTSGTYTFEMGDDARLYRHTVQVEVSAAPSTGELDVAVLVPGASLFKTLATLDLTALSNTVPDIVSFDGFYDKIKVTLSTSLEDGKTCDVFLVSGA